MNDKDPVIEHPVFQWKVPSLKLTANALENRPLEVWRFLSETTQYTPLKN